MATRAKPRIIMSSSRTRTLTTSAEMSPSVGVSIDQ